MTVLYTIPYGYKLQTTGPDQWRKLALISGGVEKYFSFQPINTWTFMVNPCLISNNLFSPYHWQNTVYYMMVYEKEISRYIEIEVFKM